MPYRLGTRVVRPPDEPTDPDQRAKGMWALDGARRTSRNQNYRHSSDRIHRREDRCSGPPYVPTNWPTPGVRGLFASIVADRASKRLSDFPRGPSPVRWDCRRAVVLPAELPARIRKKRAAEKNRKTTAARHANGAIREIAIRQPGFVTSLCRKCSPVLRCAPNRHRFLRSELQKRIDQKNRKIATNRTADGSKKNASKRRSRNWTAATSVKMRETFAAMVRLGPALSRNKGFRQSPRRGDPKSGWLVIR